MILVRAFVFMLLACIAVLFPPALLIIAPYAWIWTRKQIYALKLSVVLDRKAAADKAAAQQAAYWRSA